MHMPPLDPAILARADAMGKTGYATYLRDRMARAA